MPIKLKDKIKEVSQILRMEWKRYLYFGGAGLLALSLMSSLMPFSFFKSSPKKTASMITDWAFFASKKEFFLIAFVCFILGIIGMYLGREKD